MSILFSSLFEILVFFSSFPVVLNCCLLDPWEIARKRRIVVIVVEVGDKGFGRLKYLVATLPFKPLLASNP